MKKPVKVPKNGLMQKKDDHPGLTDEYPHVDTKNITV